MKFRLFVFVLLCCCVQSRYAQELRGVWFARDSMGTKASIARAMDSLAANNFNVVYVNCWSRGYPLWQSALFNSHTGVSIDPGFAGRDILAECIAEGHRRGLLVEAWLEYGFVGGYSGYLPGTSGKGKIFDAHPDWVAQQQNGTQIDGSNFYWMTHAHTDVQNFLIALCKEIASNYDVDGIQLDRCRYSSLNYGYDSYTDALYRAENGNNPPPSNTADTSWIRWRANKINSFIARSYDSIKAASPWIKVSNAPGHYSSSTYSAYNTYCQDWAWWVNNHKVDYVTVQNYVSNPAAFAGYIGYIKTLLQDYQLAYPSYAFKPNNIALTEAQLLGLIDTTRSYGYKGNGIWYYSQIFPYTALLKSGRYANAATPPFSYPTWRTQRDTLFISNGTDAIRTGSWLSSSLTGFGGNSLYAASGAAASVDYYMNVPVDGWYEVYAYQIISSNRSSAARYTTYNHLGTASVITVDQTNALNSGWVKLGNVELRQGRKKVITLSNTGLAAGKYISADAAMIVLNRKLSPNADNVLPVELLTFDAKVNGRLVTLQWATANEMNSSHFVVERKKEEADAWEQVTWIGAAGNRNYRSDYHYTDTVNIAGSIEYRLKMVDVVGSIEYSPTVSVTITGPAEFMLMQNYPNPFNPVTVIRYAVNQSSMVSLKIFDVLGREVAVLVHEQKAPGVYEAVFCAGNLSSGVYFYQLTSGNNTSVKKLTVVK